MTKFLRFETLYSFVLAEDVLHEHGLLSVYSQYYSLPCFDQILRHRFCFIDSSQEENDVVHETKRPRYARENDTGEYFVQDAQQAYRTVVLKVFSTILPMDKYDEVTRSRENRQGGRQMGAQENQHRLHFATGPYLRD
ncbi:hypothetical protein RB195_023903 [Necator americanus]|uniref:Uncharacterized protein n=1 Tax=Necator americanus TaxID=51031 RepID=A0ABR1EL79_NECAM